MNNVPAFYEHNRDRPTTYWRTLRVCAWIKRFTKNARSPKKDREKGPLTTTETETETRSWLRRVQDRGSEHMHVDRLQLNLQLNQDRLLECRGRLQGIYPSYVTDGTIFAEMLNQHDHKATLHGRVGLTMAKVREQYWIPRLRQQVTRVIKRCHSCKRFQAVALATPPPGQLPLERTKGSVAFEVVGVNFEGPIKYLKLS